MLWKVLKLFLHLSLSGTVNLKILLLMKQWQTVYMWPDQVELVTSQPWPKMNFRYGYKVDTKSFQNLKTPCQYNLLLQSNIKLFTWENNLGYKKELHTTIGCI